MNSEFLDDESVYSVTTNRSELSRHNHRRHHDQSSRRHKNRGEKSVTICAPPNTEQDHRKAGESLIVVDIPDRLENDNWGDTSTFISVTTDATQLSHESLRELTEDKDSSACCHDCGFVPVIVLSFVSYFSPVAIAILPHLWIINPITKACDTNCKASLLGMVFKILLLVFASWAIFFRQQTINMPRVFLFRALILFLMVLVTLTYWLFFIVFIFDQKEQNFSAIASFADSFTNCLLFVNYLSLVWLEIRQLRITHVIEVIRTTDGERRFYNVGDLSIQRCAVWVLQRYYCDFPLYNPYLLRSRSRSLKTKQDDKQQFKFFNVDGNACEDHTGEMRAVMVAAARRRDAGHNERYYEEAEYERRVRKRIARLIAATEDAFAHIRRVTADELGQLQLNSLKSDQAADNIFPALARALQKYLRTTKQHHHYNIEDITKHLSDCIQSDMTPKAFLERYLHPGPCLTYSQSHDSNQWKLISDEALINTIKDGTTFQLVQKNYSLLVTARSTPRIRIKEKFVDSALHRFVINMSNNQTCHTINC